MYVFILAGGKGTRLFPFSREDYPKQFIKFTDSKSFFQRTFLRSVSITQPENIFVVTNKDYRFHVLNQIKELNIQFSEENIILEPEGKNTAPAILYGISYLRNIIGENSLICVLPSDHLVEPEREFVEYLKSGTHHAMEGFIVTFGVKPDRPETGYGYIEIKDKTTTGTGYRVKRFHEKPDRDTAVKYISSDRYLWNIGVFMFTVKTLYTEVQKYMPELYEVFTQKNPDEVTRVYNQLPDISIDYAVMEKTDKAVCIPIDVKWSDVGSWDSMYEIQNKDDRENVRSGNVRLFNCKNSMFITQDRLVVGDSLEDVFVISSNDVVLVLKKSASQNVKDIVQELKKDKELSKFVKEHRETYRPWGKYITLEEGFRYRIKRIVVNPMESLSLQMHYHRSEHWIVVRGTAKVIFEEGGEIKEKFIHENESFYVPKTTKHRLINPGKIPLEIIEVQVGEYIDEDDIVRFDDKYGR